VVESTAVKAEYKDGILEVRIPWPEKKASLPEKVAISRG
jgi:HSP20 family molecular chaperone IbpA